MALTQIGKGGLGSTIGIGTNSPDRSLHVAGTEPSIVFEKTNESTDLKTFRIFMNSSSLQIGTVDDAFSAGVTALEITRDNTDAITGITVRSEGGATTTSLQQGLAKQWTHFDSSGTLTARDSLNVSGFTDNSTGNYNVNFSSNYGNDDYALTSTSRSNDTFESTFHGDNSTSFARVFNIRHSDRSNADVDTVMIVTHGDLA